MKSTTPNIDMYAPLYAPADVANFLLSIRRKEISRRMLSHVVHSTIGESAVPADGRGSKRTFSVQDVALIIVGMDLLDLGLPPGRVRTCVEAVREAWPELIPRDFVELLNTWPQGIRSVKIDRKYLLAGYELPDLRIRRQRRDPRGFEVQCLDEKGFRASLSQHGRPPRISYLVNWGLMLIMERIIGRRR